jgi:hypothetical protein
MRCGRCHVAWMGEGQLAYYSRVTASGVSMMSVIPLPWCKHGTQGSIALSGKRSIWNSEESGPQSSRPKPRGLSDQARPARKAGGTKRARSDLPCRRTGLQHADTLRARPLMEALVRSNHSRSNPGSSDNRQYRAVPCPTPSGALTNHKTQHGLAAARRGVWCKRRQGPSRRLKRRNGHDHHVEGLADRTMPFAAKRHAPGRICTRTVTQIPALDSPGRASTRFGAQRPGQSSVNLHPGPMLGIR